VKSHTVTELPGSEPLASLAIPTHTLAPWPTYNKAKPKHPGRLVDPAEPLSFGINENQDRPEFKTSP